MIIINLSLRDIKNNIARTNIMVWLFNVVVYVAFVKAYNNNVSSLSLPNKLAR